MSKLTRSEKNAFQEWIELKKLIHSSTYIPTEEKPQEKKKRIEKLLKNFERFVEYYFPHYCDSPLGWFHKKAARDRDRTKNGVFLDIWPREHAKSVYNCVMRPMWDKAKGNLTGLLIGSATQEKAIGLLSDLQAELESNQRYINDFGDQKSIAGDWGEGHFVDNEGNGYWAFGRGQSPRGVRESAKRPNRGVIDDIDDDKSVKNPELVQKGFDWVMGAFFGALSIKDAQLSVCGNLIHPKSILAHIAGIQDGGKGKKGVVLTMVYATEDKNHKELPITDPNSKPAWERYTKEELAAKFDAMGYRLAQREYYHKHMEIGHTFKPEHTTWRKRLKLKDYEGLVGYCDPSYKGTKKNDFKSVILLGKKGKRYDILWAWLRQASVKAMVNAHFNMIEWIGDANSRQYFEASFNQDSHGATYEEVSEERSIDNIVRQDRRKKPDKGGRIEMLSVLWESGALGFNEEFKDNIDMQMLLNQFLAFPHGPDDGPDSVEGAHFHLKNISRRHDFGIQLGNYRQTTKR